LRLKRLQAPLSVEARPEQSASSTAAVPAN